jgi:hypothetical protein
MGLNEAAGYLAVAVTAYLTGLIAAGPGYARNRSTSAWPMPASGWGCRCCWSARPAGTPASKPSWPIPIGPRARTARLPHTQPPLARTSRPPSDTDPR